MKKIEFTQKRLDLTSYTPKEAYLFEVKGVKLVVFQSEHKRYWIVNDVSGNIVIIKDSDICTTRQEAVDLTKKLLKDKDENQIKAALLKELIKNRQNRQFNQKYIKKIKRLTGKDTHKAFGVSVDVSFLVMLLSESKKTNGLQVDLYHTYYKADSFKYVKDHYKKYLIDRYGEEVWNLIEEIEREIYG
jgi:hypothetical protein